MIRHLMAVTTALRLPAFVIDKRLMLAGYNPLFAELARKAGISQYMLNRPLYETPKFPSLVICRSSGIIPLRRCGATDTKIHLW
jgi:hypothetical protein